MIFSPKEDNEKTDEEKAAEKRKKPRAQHPDAQGNENAARNLMVNMNELQSNLAALHSIAERRTRQ